MKQLITLRMVVTIFVLIASVTVGAGINRQAHPHLDQPQDCCGSASNPFIPCPQCWSEVRK